MRGGEWIKESLESRQNLARRRAARGGRGEKGNVEMGIKQLTKLIGDAAPDAIKVGP